MDNNVRDQIKRGRNVLAYRATHPAAFAGAKAALLSGQVQSSIDHLVELGADQQEAGGGALAGTAGLNSLVDAVRRDIMLIVGTARTIRKSGGNLAFAFDLPRSEADDIVVAAGEAFYRELSKPGVEAQFLEWEIRTDFLADLRADLDAYEGKLAGRNADTQGRKDAVAAIATEEKALIDAIDGLDTLFKNKYQGDAAAYREWREASKLVRTRVHPKKETPAK